MDQVRVAVKTVAVVKDAQVVKKSAQVQKVTVKTHLSYTSRSSRK